MGLDGLRAGWLRATVAGGPGQVGLRFGPRWAAGVEGGTTDLRSC
jgi:hypothetical protein